MRATYRVLCGLTMLLVLVQSAAIAFGTFGILDFVSGGDDYTKSIAEDRSADAGGLGQNIHSFGAMAIALVAIILLVVSFFARIDGGVKWAGIVFLTVVLQWVFAIVAFSAPVVGILHGINAFFIFGTAMTAMQHAKAVEAEAPATAPA
ncbi:MAG: hypothetical protein HOQ22_04825 [Nocardioidaceae bacterium]|nr:hypothetical protein [Nocardioidaceae bacterium]NUS50351.1 hypothetical protein [Nocardioidaceae bacterium]